MKQVKGIVGYREPVAASHNLRASTSVNGGTKYIHLDLNTAEDYRQQYHGVDSLTYHLQSVVSLSSQLKVLCVFGHAKNAPAALDLLDAREPKQHHLDFLGILLRASLSYFAGAGCLTVDNFLLFFIRLVRNPHAVLYELLSAAPIG